jgi:hypothetical protein
VFEPTLGGRFSSQVLPRLGESKLGRVMRSRRNYWSRLRASAVVSTASSAFSAVFATATRRRYRGITAVGACLCLAATPIVAAPSAQALGQVGSNAAAAYAIDVPSSVLAAAAPASRSGAALASSQQFDWKFAESQFGSVSGTLTNTPAAPSTLSPADAAEWEKLTQRFAAPATRATSLVRYGAEPLLAFQVGTMIGAGGARVFGFTDDQVCSQRNAALTIAASVVDGVDCNAYNNTLAEGQRNSDQTPITTASSVTLAGSTITYLRSAFDGQPQWGTITCFRWEGSLPEGYDDLIIHTTGVDGTLNSATSSMHATPPLCNSSNRPGDTYANMSGWWITGPMQSYSAWFQGPGKPKIMSDVVTGTSVTPNPTRRLLCRIVASGTEYDRTSAPFTESDSVIPAVSCPTIPPGKRLQNVQIIESSEQGGDLHFVARQLPGVCHRLLPHRPAG